MIFRTKLDGPDSYHGQGVDAAYVIPVPLFLSDSEFIDNAHLNHLILS
jgi:hypothetical protein